MKAAQEMNKYIKQIWFGIWLLLPGIQSFAQSLENLSFGSDTTFDVVSWNIEWFPKNDQVTIDYVSQIIDALDVDVLAIQEVDDRAAFQTVIDQLDGYEGYLESSYFAGLAYIYKKGFFQINAMYEIYTSSPYWSPFPRSPMLMDLTFMNERIIVINNHFKCCGNGILDLDDPGDEESRRYKATKLLKDYIDTNFPAENVIVLGDLNDVLTDDSENNVFQLILDDTENYAFVDYEIAAGNESVWSYPTWPSHLDHILITNELFDEFEKEGSAIRTLKIEDYMGGGWWDYEKNVSDHRPLAMKLQMDPVVSMDASTPSTMNFSSYPNPFHTKTRLSFENLESGCKIEIYNLQGQIVFSGEIPPGETSILWNAEGLPAGMYIASLSLNEGVLGTLKLIRTK